MRVVMIAIATLLAAVTAACVDSPASSTTNVPGMPAMGPTHPPTTPQQWEALERAAQGRVEQAGMDEVGQPQRLINTGFMVEHDVALAEKTCYEAGLAWSFSGKAHVAISYQPGADGAMPNDQLAGTGDSLEGGAGTVRFCSDHAGAAKLTISSVGPSGAITNNELLEYALVLGSKAETEEETIARREDEAQRGAAADAQIKANIAAAEERERQRMAGVCRECEDAFILCRSNRAAGASSSGNSCELDYQLCPFRGMRYEYERADDKTPCD
jgi:hypothetical protein